MHFGLGPQIYSWDGDGIINIEFDFTFLTIGVEIGSNTRMDEIHVCP
jgi:hypothetical protein